MVLRELVTACRFAASPTNRSPVLENATTDGVTRRPSEFSRTSGSPPSITAMHELVVPKSIPITFAIKLVSDCLSVLDSFQLRLCQLWTVSYKSLSLLKLPNVKPSDRVMTTCDI